MLDLYETDNPDGTRQRRVVAVGNVVFLRNEERIAGQSLDLDLDTGRGTFREARGYLQPGILVEARLIERLDAETYRVEGASFTSCYQTVPRWSFQASAARIHLDDKVVARNVWFKVKQVPAFYTPILVYPIRKDQRATGFLLPHFGYSTQRGFNLGDAFFWAMGRSADQTFYFDRYSRYGYGFGHELRYLLDSSSGGNFKSYLFRVTELPSTDPQGNPTTAPAEEWDYTLDWSAQQTLPGRVSAALGVNVFSKASFQERIQDNLDLISRRDRNQSLSLQRSFAVGTLRLLADSKEVFDGDQRSSLFRHLPQLSLNGSPLRVLRSPLRFTLDAGAERIERRDATRVEPGGDQGIAAGDEPLARYSRADLKPSISATAGTPFLRVTPRVALRYTRWGASLADPEAPVPDLIGKPIERRYFEGGLELAGPTFSRVFDQTGEWSGGKLKHVIGPEIVFTYRTQVDDVDYIPWADQSDRMLGTRQIQYALVQRLYGRRPGRGGSKPVPYEILAWRLQRTFYFDIDHGQNLFDSAYASGTARAWRNRIAWSHDSPFLSELTLHPTASFDASFKVQYDTQLQQPLTLDLRGHLRTERMGLECSWARARRELVAGKVERVNTLKASGNLELVPGHLGIDASLTYDRVSKHLTHSKVRLRYSVQCCGFSAEMIHTRYNGPADRTFRVAIELANIGTFGTSLGSQPGQPLR